MATRKLREGSASNEPAEVEKLVQAVLRESYEQTTSELRDYAEKVRHFNALKRNVREYLAALRKLKADVVHSAREQGVTVGCNAKQEASVVATLLKEKSRPWKADEVAAALCIPDRVPVAGVTSISLLDNEIAQWEDQLRGVGDDAQLSMIELQNVLQRQQQVLQLLSNVSKVLNDTTMAIIRNIRV